MKKLIVALIFACLVSLALLPVVSTSANSEERRVTKALWYTPINGTALTSETIDDVNNDGHEDILVVSTEEGGGYMTLINGKDGSTIRKISLDYEPTEVLCLQDSDSIAVAYVGGMEINDTWVDVFDMELNLKFSIPTYHTRARVYDNAIFYWTGIWWYNQSEYGIRGTPWYDELYQTWQPRYPVNPYGYTENLGYFGEAPMWFMQAAAELPAPFTWNPYPYVLNISLDLPAFFPYQPKHLTTFDGTDLLYTEGYYHDVGNNTDVASYSLANGTLNWRTGGVTAPLTNMSINGYVDPYYGNFWIFGPIFGITDLVVLSPTRAVAIERTIGMAGLNFTNPSPLGEWPLILLDQNGAQVEQYTIARKEGDITSGNAFYHTCVENATYERHTVADMMPYDETRFLLTVTGVEASVIVCYSIANDDFTIVWKKPVDRGDLNRGFLIDDLNNDGDKEIIAIINENVTVLDGTDGSTLYTTDVPTFTVVDVAHLSLGDVILTNEGNGVLVTFGSSNHTTYWNQTLGVAWETYISPMQDVDEDGHTDLIVARESNVTCFWGYYEIYTPPPIPIQEELWFWIAIMVVLDAVVIGVVGYMRRRTLARETAATA